MTTERRTLGAIGEDAAARWYEAAGYRVVDRNWRTREGEIDLVVRRGSLVVFCEVKTRSSSAFGAGSEAVTAAKQRRLRRLAAAWLAAFPSVVGARREVRFDVASLTAGVLDVVEDAF